MAAENIDVELAQCLFGGRILDRTREPDAGRRHQRIDASLGMHDVVEKSRDRLLIGDVKRVVSPRLGIARSPASAINDVDGRQPIGDCLADA